MWSFCAVALVGDRYLGTSPSGLPYVTVITETHIPAPLSQPEPAVCNTTKKQLAHPERSATHRPTSSSVQLKEGSQFPPTDRPSIYAWAPLHPGSKPTDSLRRPRPCPIGLPTGIFNPRPASTVASCRDSLPPLSAIDHRPSLGTRLEIHLDPRRSPQCCRQQQPGVSPERPRLPPFSRRQPPPPHIASLRRQQHN